MDSDQESHRSNSDSNEQSTSSSHSEWAADFQLRTGALLSQIESFRRPLLALGESDSDSTDSSASSNNAQARSSGSGGSINGRLQLLNITDSESDPEDIERAMDSFQFGEAREVSFVRLLTQVENLEDDELMSCVWSIDHVEMIEEERCSRTASSASYSGDGFISDELEMDEGSYDLY